MNVEGTYIDGAEWALYFLPSRRTAREGNTVYCFPEATQKESKNCGNCGKPTPEWACPDRTRDGMVGVTQRPYLLESSDAQPKKDSKAVKSPAIIVMQRTPFQLM